MARELSLFFGTFTTLLAIINPFEVLPVYLKLLEGKDADSHRQVAWRSCVYALLLSLLLPDFWNTDPALVRSATDYGSNCRRHHPDEDRL